MLFCTPENITVTGETKEFAVNADSGMEMYRTHCVVCGS